MTFAGNTPVVVVRDRDGEIYGFKNRCSHRGALIALEKSGKVEQGFQCVYQVWTYNVQGDLTGVAFERGVKDKAMPQSFCKEEHSRRKLRVATFCGLVTIQFSMGAVP